MDERIYDIEAREAIKVAIRRPQFTHSVLTTQRSNPRIVNTRPGHTACCQQGAQIGPMLFRLGEQYERRRLKQQIDVVESNGERCRRTVYSRACHNSEEFMQAGPGNGPCRTALGQLREAAHRRLVKRSILAVRVDQDVGVEGYHPPRPSYARSRIFSQSASRNSGTNPSPLNVTMRNLKGRPTLRSAMIFRNPCSTRARRVVRSRVAIFRASRNKGSDISSVVFTAHIPVCINMGSNIMIAKLAATAIFRSSNGQSYLSRRREPQFLQTAPAGTRRTQLCHHEPWMARGEDYTGA